LFSLEVAKAKLASISGSQYYDAFFIAVAVGFDLESSPKPFKENPITTQENNKAKPINQEYRPGVIGGEAEQENRADEKHTPCGYSSADPFNVVQGKMAK
jgi:hypothetical protein